MTAESELAKQVAVHFEGWKWKITEQTGGKFRIPFDVKSEELPESIKNAPVGTRFMIAVVELNDDETPRIPQGNEVPAAPQQLVPSDSSPVEGKPGRKWEDLPCVTRAGILSSNSDFLEYVSKYMNDPRSPEAYIRDYCLVASRKDIDGDSHAESLFIKMCEDFETWKKFIRGRQ